MKKNLIYYTVGLKDVYSDLLKKSIESIELSNQEKIEILILTDKEYFQKNFLDYKKDNVSFFFIPETKNFDQACFNKLKIFEYPKIHSFENVIYLDSDTLVNNDLNSLLNKCISDDKLYVVVEDYNILNHKRIQFSLGNYKNEDLYFFEKNKIYTFNCGTYMFKPTISMKKHFNNVLEIIDKHNGPYFTDQSFMNYYFNTQNLIDNTTILKDVNYKFVVNSNFNENLNIDNCILHLITEGDDKNNSLTLDRMNNLISRMKQSVENIPKQNVSDMRIVLIQVWLGEIPDYFWHHYETTKNLKNIDFLFFTDQNLILNSENYKVVKITMENLENLVNAILKGRLNSTSQIKILNNKKICDLKASYGDIFQNLITEYDYYGFYDIDTLFGDINFYIRDYLGEYDIITIANEKYHHRIGGPFTIFKNEEKLRKEYACDAFIECFKNSGVDSFEEQTLNNKVKDRYKIKHIFSVNCETDNGGKNVYQAYWSGGKLFIKGVEKFIYHFYKKNTTVISRAGNMIIANEKKIFIEDFYWVVYFTKNYEKMFNNLLESIKKYSNRKCLIYSINYDYRLPIEETFNEQFILKRFDIKEGEKDQRGRDFNIICCKPLIHLDAISSFPNKKFVGIDTDSYLTVNSDSISKYFSELENYPLYNMHIHDVIYLNNINPNEEWTSTLHVLLNEMGIHSNSEYENLIKPRRKANILIFDNKCEWFLKEQMYIFNTYKNKKPGILSFQDEDAGNALLVKYGLKKSLPLIDIEESDYINMDIFHKYSYSATSISPFVILPKTKNDVLIFHGLKHQKQYDDIIKNYDKKVLQSDEFSIKYENNTIFFEKNSFLDNKEIATQVDFLVKDVNGNVILSFNNQNIFQYFMFYITDLIFEKGVYLIEIYESDTQNKIYQNTIKI